MKTLTQSICKLSALLLIAYPSLSQAAPTGISANMEVAPYFIVFNSGYTSDLSEVMQMTYDPISNRYSTAAKKVGFYTSNSNNGLRMKFVNGGTVTGNNIENKIELKIQLFNIKNAWSFSWIKQGETSEIPKDKLGWGNPTIHESSWFNLNVTAADGYNRPSNDQYTGTLSIVFEQPT
jgi:hypothetical protein